MSISGTILEQLEQWRPDVLDTFKQLTNTGRVEIVAVDVEVAIVVDVAEDAVGAEGVDYGKSRCGTSAVPIEFAVGQNVDIAVVVVVAPGNLGARVDRPREARRAGGIEEK